MKEKEVIVEICSDLECRRSGGESLADLANHLTQEERTHVEINIVKCMKTCRDKNDELVESLPFLRINGNILHGISNDELIQIVKEYIRNAVR